MYVYYLFVTLCVIVSCVDVFLLRNVNVNGKQR